MPRGDGGGIGMGGDQLVAALAGERFDSESGDDDCEAAERAGLPTIGVLTGGFSEAELRDAGATSVVRSLVELRDGLARTPSGG